MKFKVWSRCYLQGEAGGGVLVLARGVQDVRLVLHAVFRISRRSASGTLLLKTSGGCGRAGRLVFGHGKEKGGVLRSWVSG